MLSRDILRTNLYYKDMSTYIERTKCIFCRSQNIQTLFKENFTIPLGCYAVENDRNNQYMPFNITMCNNCKTYQTQYLGDIQIVYNYKAKPYGKIRDTMYDVFTSFVLQNANVEKNVEIGGGSGTLCNLILKQKEVEYTIIDPEFSGENNNVHIINDFFENVDIIDGDTIIMSHVFEHFYDPLDVMEKIHRRHNIKYIYINHPDLENFVREGSYLVLNPEHTFYIENRFLEELFLKYGFKLNKTYNHMKFAIFFEFERISTDINYDITPINYSSEKDIELFFNNLQNRVKDINNTLSTLPKDTKKYIWPCSMHTTYLLTFGLSTSLLDGVLDNSEYKIGKYLYGQALKCFSFNEIINQTGTIAIVLNGGVYNQEIQVQKQNITLIE